MAEPARPDWLTDEVVAAVTAHMNGDHAEDNVVICRVAGGRDDTTSAELVDLDGEAVVFRTGGPTGERLLRIPFSAPLADRAQIRAEVARMYHESAAALGLPPREH